jgi:hypothetical protein
MELLPGVTHHEVGFTATTSTCDRIETSSPIIEKSPAGAHLLARVRRQCRDVDWLASRAKPRVSLAGGSRRRSQRNDDVPAQ